MFIVVDCQEIVHPVRGAMFGFSWCDALCRQAFQKLCTGIALLKERETLILHRL
jgi:hypothetical protein